VIVVGASAGGIPALIAILAALPQDFPIPILIVQHLAARAPSVLPTILGWRTRLAVRWAADGDELAPSHIYVAPPNRHLVIGPGGRLALSDAERIGWWRPAADALFQSAAACHKEKTIGIVLSGAMWDGAAGMAAIAAAGGITIAQDQASAGFFDMPAAACDFGRADLVMSPAQIANALRVLSERTVANENCWEAGRQAGKQDREQAL
jgi:two-component system chemotaxis response regulator CheB